MHYLITGHTGFKGSWLSLMLKMQGHTVSGISLEPHTESLFERANLRDIFEYNYSIDIRNPEKISSIIRRIAPEVVVHLAAQPLVRESYKTPIETFDVNVMGTLNVLEATQELKTLKAALIITTDKVYKNHNHLRGYNETDELGGEDPYSASKAAADIAAQSWIRSFAKVPMAIARAGNVIGGGDWAIDRIVPDLINAYSNNRTPALRYPNAIRPWQHVLDCLSGYLALLEESILNGVGGEWNFGPDLSEKYSVADLASEFANKYQIKGNTWNLEAGNHPHESSYLLLDSDKARKNLNWKEKLNFQDSVAWTAEWYLNTHEENIRDFTMHQISRYFEL